MSEDRYFEDCIPGAVFEFGEIRVSEGAIIEFARRFDPQTMHVDPETAARGPFGGLIASGWHTTAMMMRVVVDHFLPKHASLGSPGIDELRWLRPVRSLFQSKKRKRSRRRRRGGAPDRRPSGPQHQCVATRCADGPER